MPTASIATAINDLIVFIAKLFACISSITSNLFVIDLFFRNATAHLFQSNQHHTVNSPKAPFQPPPLIQSQTSGSVPSEPAARNEPEAKTREHHRVGPGLERVAQNGDGVTVKVNFRHQSTDFIAADVHEPPFDSAFEGA
jgi:hypothetical protein